MITTKNIAPYAGGVKHIKDRAAHLVQGMENCPLEDTLIALAQFDKWNSGGAKSPSAKRWIKRFCGFESHDSGKEMTAIIQVLNDGQLVDSKRELIALMEGMPAAPRRRFQGQVDDALSVANRVARSLKCRDIALNIAWEPGNGPDVNDLPTSAGIYAEIHWLKAGVRVGETGQSIRGKIRHDIRWFTSMYDGSAPPNQLCRSIPIAQTAKKYGAGGFEFYVVSCDPKLEDKELRQECERFMFAWLEKSRKYESWNHQRSWR